MASPLWLPVVRKTSIVMSFNMPLSTLRRYSVIIGCALLTGCGGGGGTTSVQNSNEPPAALPDTATASAPTPETSGDLIRVGDKITVRLTGVPDANNEGYIIEMQVPASGDISVPLIKDRSFHVVGRTPSDVATEIMETYKAEKIYTSPVVTIVQEERFVSVGGDVRNPMRVLYTPDLTLTGAINAAGGFTEYAKRGAVRVLRGQQVMQIDANAAAKSPGSDPLLRPGDQVYVPRTMF